MNLVIQLKENIISKIIYFSQKNFRLTMNTCPGYFTVKATQEAAGKISLIFTG